jgi:ABC-type proline/glycine betaine transport system ATPase subunit
MLLGSRIALLEDGNMVSLNSPEGFLNSSEPLVAKYVEAFGAPFENNTKRGCA